MECPGLIRLRQDMLGQDLDSTTLEEGWTVQGLNEFLSSRLVADLEGLQVSEEDYDVGVVVSPTQ